MKKHTLLLLLSACLLSSCKKDKDMTVIGTVVQLGGCFSNSYLVSIESAPAGFGCAPMASDTALGTMYNCSNAVYIRLEAPLSTPGTRIAFRYQSTEPSCLSFSRAPEHINVADLRKL